MFSKVAILATLSLALAAAAAAAPSPGGGKEYKCNTGKAYCCNQVQQAKSAQGTEILAILDAAAQGITGTVGSNCGPITAVGLRAVLPALINPSAARTTT